MTRRDARTSPAAHPHPPGGRRAPRTRAVHTGGVTDDDHRPASPPTLLTGRRELEGALAVVVAAFVVTASQVGGVVLLVLLAPDGGVAAVLLGASGLALLTIAPIALGAVLAARDLPTSEEDQRSSRRLLWWALGAQAGGAALVLLSAGLGDPPAWIPASFVALGAALTVVALVAGPSVGEHVRRDAVPVAWRAVAHGEVRRGIRTVTLAFVLTFVPASVGFSFIPVDDGSWADLLLIAAGLAFLAASLACTALSFRLMKQAAAVIGRDQARARRIGKAVFSRRPLELSPDDERVAARWASVSAVSVPVQFAQTAMLFAGLVCVQLPQAFGEDGWVFSRLLVVAMVVILLSFVPFLVSRATRARRFAGARTHLLVSDERP
jgi:hypothetical protein